jgi:hypothetical protein
MRKTTHGFRLITPPALLFTTAMLAIYATYAFLIGSIEDSVPLLTAGVLSVVSCIGTALMKPWSRYFVYLVTLGLAARFAASVRAAHAAGYFEFQYASTNEAVRSLVPETSIMALGLLCCVLVYLHFRSRG